MMTKKNILITNDDGFDSVGLKYLVLALKEIANIIVVAPSTNKSACGHSMTLIHPLRFKQFNDDSYYLQDGTPTDCVFLGLNHLYGQDNAPDLVISGINLGSNMGEDITYSGTVAGAMEAVLQGVPAIAISQAYNKDNATPREDWDFTLAIKTIVDIVSKILNGTFPLGHRRLLNINIPQIDIEECNGIKITKAGYRVFSNDYKTYHDPKGNEFHWIGLHPLKWESDNSCVCDFEAIDNNFISITPIKLDMTSYDDIKKLESWIQK